MPNNEIIERDDNPIQCDGPVSNESAAEQLEDCKPRIHNLVLGTQDGSNIQVDVLANSVFEAIDKAVAQVMEDTDRYDRDYLNPISVATIDQRGELSVTMASSLNTTTPQVDGVETRITATRAIQLIRELSDRNDDATYRRAVAEILEATN